MGFIRRIKTTWQAGVEATIGLLIVTAHGVKTIFIIALVIVGLGLAAWWVLPNDWRVKYAAEYQFDYDQILIDRKPHNCEWATAPLGDKHCHYEKVVTVFNRKNEVIEGPAPTNPAPEDQKPVKVFVAWERVED
jgi:hypothetical protein